MTPDEFESTVDAVVNGDLDGVRARLGARPDLVHARSSRDHHATLLHDLAANGVEDERQRSPANAPAVARMLLDAGADPDALADLYGGRYSTLTMHVSSTPPARAGVQVALVEVLADGGASLEPLGSGVWTSPLFTALAFRFSDAAAALARRGARADTLPLVAGLGRTDETRRLLPGASGDDRHRALALAAQLGHASVVSLLLDAGADPNRFNPEGVHSYSTPLHQAAWAGHLPIVRLLVERGARADVEDTVHHATPCRWAAYAGHAAIADYLRSVESR